jgi:hypothetical protein
MANLVEVGRVERSVAEAAKVVRRIKMPSPFPGMDPYIEASGGWEDFHDRFLTHCGEALLEVLPSHYLVKVQERIAAITVPDADEKRAVLDIGISAPESARGNRDGGASTATIEPVTLEHLYAEPLKETYIQILRRPDRKLVTVIELLSPTNKEGRGRDAYIEKRDALLAQYVHIVEIDLLVQGARLQMKTRLPAGDYYAFVSRAERRFKADVYAWTVRHPLPVIPIPLLEPDPDYKLELAGLFRYTYDRGHYERDLDYKIEPPAFLRPADREWARELLTKHT